MLSAHDIADRARRGLAPAGAAIDESLKQIEALDRRLHAWVHVDRAGALAAAGQTDQGDRTDRPKARLLGVPVGVKDIFDAAGLPTGLGAAPFAGYVAPEDATAVARLRAAGAIILGKTATTEFAFLDPAATTNPWDLDHTPGGSSSGSAAAVAAGMVPLALGSQTVGSVLRPAAYCGVVGLKPTHGLVDAAGVHPLAPSFDHVGVLCRDVRDAALAFAVLSGLDTLTPDEALGGSRPPRIGLARRFYEGVAGAEVSRHLDAIAALLAGAGASVSEIEMPAAAQEVVDLGQAVLRAEAAAIHAERFAAHGDDYRENICGLIEAGLATSAVDYLKALEVCGYLREAIVERLAGFDVILLPSAPTTAPAGLGSTGSAIFCAPASFAGLPAIALPSGLGEGGLPLSVQLVAAPYAEATLLRSAAWVERVLDFQSKPPLNQ